MTWTCLNCVQFLLPLFSFGDTDQNSRGSAENTRSSIFFFFVQFYFILSNVSAMHCEQNLSRSGNFKNMFLIFYSPIQHCCSLTIKSVCISAPIIPSNLLHPADQLLAGLSSIKTIIWAEICVRFFLPVCSNAGCG